MATTTPFPFRSHYDRDAHTPEHQQMVTELIEEYESNLADSDKAADGYDVGIYTGAWEAYFHALVMLCGIDPAVVTAYHKGEDVRPANTEVPVMPGAAVHVPGQHYADANAFMTRADLVTTGYHLMPESGWWVYDGPRLVTVTQWDKHGDVVKQEQVEHAQILRVLQDHLDELAILTGPDDPYYEMAEAAISMVFSDVQTGTSLHSWDIARRLVDRSLTAATLRLDYPGHRITTQWEEF